MSTAVQKLICAILNRKLDLLTLALHDIRNEVSRDEIFIQSCLAQDVKPPSLDTTTVNTPLDENNKTALMLAAELGWIDGVRKLLEEKNVGVTLKDKGEKSALHYAAIGGDTLCCAVIFNLCKDQLYQIDANNRTPLILAAKNNREDAVEYFCEQLTTVSSLENPQKESKSGHSEFALQRENHNKPSLAESLKKSLKTINLLDCDQMSALMYAAKLLNPFSTKTLIEAGANINIVNTFYQFTDESGTPQVRFKTTALHIALYPERDRTTKTIEIKDQKSDTQTETAKLLMNELTVNCFDQMSAEEEYQTPFHLAAYICRTEIIKSMASEKHKARIWTPMKHDNKTRDVLTLAAASNGDPKEQEATIIFLCETIKAIAEESEVGKILNPQRAFELATMNCRPLAMNQIWLTFDINSNVINRDQESLLFALILAKNHTEESFKAALDILDSKQFKREMGPKKYKTLTKKEVNELLIKKARLQDEDKRSLSESDKPNLLRNPDLDFNAQSKHPKRNGFTPLMTAVIIGNQAALKVLKEQKRIDLSRRDLNGRTALHHAIEQRVNPEMILDLIEMGLIQQNNLVHLFDKYNDKLVSFYQQEEDAMHATKTSLKKDRTKGNLRKLPKVKLPDKPNNFFEKWACHLIIRDNKGSTRNKRTAIFIRTMINFYEFYLNSNKEALIRGLCDLKIGLSNLTSGSETVKEFLEGLLKLSLDGIKDQFATFIQLLNPEKENKPYENLRQQLHQFTGIHLVAASKAAQSKAQLPADSKQTEKPIPSPSQTSPTNNKVKENFETKSNVGNHPTGHQDGKLPAQNDSFTRPLALSLSVLQPPMPLPHRGGSAQGKSGVVSPNGMSSQHTATNRF